MTKKAAYQLRDTLVALTPPFPERISLWEMQLRLQTRRGITLTRENLAHHLKKAIRSGYIAFLGPRGYTRPANPREKALAASYSKPKPLLTHPRHNATPGLRTQLAQANAALAAQLLKGASVENKFEIPSKTS